MSTPIVRPITLREEWAVRTRYGVTPLANESDARAMASCDPSWRLLRRQVTDWTEVPS